MDSIRCYSLVWEALRNMVDEFHWTIRPPSHDAYVSFVHTYLCALCVFRVCSVDCATDVPTGCERFAFYLLTYHPRSVNRDMFWWTRANDVFDIVQLHWLCSNSARAALTPQLYTRLSDGPFQTFLAFMFHYYQVELVNVLRSPPRLVAQIGHYFSLSGWSFQTSWLNSS